MMKPLLISAAVAIAIAMPAAAVDCEGASGSPAASAQPVVYEPDPTLDILSLYASVEARHRLAGLASYYSDSLDGTLTSTPGERYHKHKLTAAHLTLPLGTVVEVRSKATGKRVRLLVNDRGPYVKKFCLDLSHAAARALGVDKADDRTVTIRIIKLPGQPALPSDVIAGPIGVASEEAGW
jgi:peptidoglycan lytic transglycosylase